MLGPVFYQEMVLGARRGRWHWLRWLYAGWTVFILSFWLLGFLFFAQAFYRRPINLSDLAAFSRDIYLPYFTFQHFSLLALISPILVAGAASDEKATGTLQYLLTADLLPGEILLGKLAARAYQVSLLLLIGMPIVCFMGVFGDLDLLKVGGFVLSSLILVLSLGCMSLLASVWCRHSRDAVLSVYTILGVWLYVWYRHLHGFLIDPQSAEFWQHAGHSLNLLAPMGEDWLVLAPREYIDRLTLFVACWGGLGLVCLFVAVARLRGAYVRQLERSGRKGKSPWWQFRRPGIGESPLVWKERFIEGIAPLTFLRKCPMWLGLLATFAATTAVCLWILDQHLTSVGETRQTVWNLLIAGDVHGLLLVREKLMDTAQSFYWMGWGVIAAVVLIVGARCSGAITGEREKKTWEALLLTPLETRQLTRGKMWGIAGASVPYLMAFMVPALFFSWWASWGAFFWMLLWTGVAALAVFYAGSVGIWCSARAKTSWRSLMGTMIAVYAGGAVLWGVLSFFSCFLAIFLWLLVTIVDGFLERAYGITLGLGTFGASVQDFWPIAMNILLAASFLLISAFMLHSAEKRISTRERIRHWKKQSRYYRQPPMAQRI